MPVQSQTCNLAINYAEVPGERILPFVIELDTTASVLNPTPGTNQRFCYNITGIGSEGAIFADLSHIVFGICNSIPLMQIANISVVVDGIAATVIIGDNVDLMTAQNPDPQTGCAGLKFDFAVNRISGTMTVCFELTIPHSVGPIPVCLYGGGEPATGLSICGPVCSQVGTCTAIGYQPVSVCVPVTVTPFANPGIPVTYCCGAPIITPDTQICPGEINGSCTFIMEQEICVAVPVEFGADTLVGDTSVLCGDATDEDICTECAEEEIAGSAVKTAADEQGCGNCKKK